MVPDDPFWGDFLEGVSHLNRDLLRTLRDGPLESTADVEAALALVGLLRTEYLTYGTDGTNTLDGPEVRDLQRTARTVLGRFGISLDVPWGDFDGFRPY